MFPVCPYGGSETFKREGLLGRDQALEVITLRRDPLILMGSYSVLARTSPASSSLVSSLSMCALLHMAMASPPYCDSARKTLTSQRCHGIFQLSDCGLSRHIDYNLCSIKNFVKIIQATN